MKAESINTNAIGATVLCYLLGRIHITHRKFWSGYSFSIANCDVRSWGQYMRDGSNLMRLTPHSAFSIEAKNGSSPGRKAASSGAQDAEALTQMLPQPLHLSPSGGLNLILQK